MSPTKAAPVLGPGSTPRARVQTPASHRASHTPLTLAVGTTVALTPILVPAGPGNTSLADVAMVAAILIAAVTVSGTRARLRLPYSAGVTLMVIGGLVGALSSGAPVHVVIVLVQDIILLLWCFVVALGRDDPRLIEVVTRTWCRTAPVLATLGVCAYVVGFAPLSGVTAADASRASYTFGDPNLAGNYFVLSLIVMYACRRPVNKRLRWTAYAIVLTALVMTGSNGGMLSLALALSGWVILKVLLSRGATAALVALSMCGAAIVAGSQYLAPRIDLASVRVAAAEAAPILRDSVGRSDGSAGEREALLREGTRLWFAGEGTGVGPARTKATLLAFQAPYVKEAHNDYLATLLERGPIGVIGLLLLVLAAGTYLRRILGARLHGAWHDAVPRAWALVITAPVLALAAAFYEVLHFRHVWTWLGLVAALALVPRQSPPEGEVRS